MQRDFLLNDDNDDDNYHDNGGDNADMMIMIIMKITIIITIISLDFVIKLRMKTNARIQRFDII